MIINCKKAVTRISKKSSTFAADFIFMRMKKRQLCAVLIAGMVIAACTQQNTPDNPATDEQAYDTTAVVPAVVDTLKDTLGLVTVVYYDTTAVISASSDILPYLTLSRSGAHVRIVQSDNLATEITYNLSGTSKNGEFYTEGAYKATIELDGLTITNGTPVFSGAAVHVQNSKRIKVKPITGTTSTLKDAASGSQKGALYVKGHIEFAQKGTLNIYGYTKHGIKAGEYISIKNATINVLSAAGDGINCEQYFLMESGNVTISGVGDDGLQCDIEDAATGSTGETADHEEEDSGNVYISGGSININVTATAAKGIKAEGDVSLTGGTINITTTGAGTWDADDLETKAASCISSDADMSISGGTLTLKSTGSGGKGLKCDGALTISESAAISITTTGALYYNNGSTENTNYTGNTDNLNNDYYSSPKGVKSTGAVVISGGKISVKTSGRNGEGIESKSTMDITGGEVAVESYDDAINAASHLTISGGYVYARSTNNDGIDANGNCYLKGGLVYAVSASSPEVAIDANTEGGYKLYVQGGTIVAIGGLENSSTLTQSCYQASSWSKNTWYALTVGGDVFAFKTPSSGGSKLVVSGASTPTLTSGVTASGTEIFDGVGFYPATASGGSSVSLSTYSSNAGGGPGGGRGW